jgi:hypothetical protein
MSAAEAIGPSRAGTRAGLRPEPILTRIALAMGLSLLLTIPAFLLDGRMFQGENVWVKPIKFQVALAVYFGTLAVYASWLPQGMLQSPRLRLFLVAVGFATLAEMIWIGGAAMFATASHFNTNPLLYGVYLLMGAFAVLLTSASLVLGLAFWRDRASALPEAVRLSLSLGLLLTFILTLIVAGALSARSGHFVGTPTQGAALPLLGWSREVGDLRVAHFFATHALHVVPLFGVAALALRQDSHRRALVWAGAGAFAAFTIFTFVQALSGRSFP